MKKSKLLIERLNKTGPGIEPCAAPKNSFVIVAISIKGQDVIRGKSDAFKWLL